MKAMILAAGRGERLRPLTDTTPKPLIEAGGKPLIVWQLEALKRAGVTDVVINLDYLGGTIQESLGDGGRHGVAITYSREPPGALDTGGGIANALPLLGNDPFFLVNGDVWTDLDFSTLTIRDNVNGHLVLVDKPAHQPAGDFGLVNGLATNTGATRFTYTGIAILRPAMFEPCPKGRFPLTPLLRRAVSDNEVSGERYPGLWFDAGAPERLAELRRQLTVTRA